MTTISPWVRGVAAVGVACCLTLLFRGGEPAPEAPPEFSGPVGREKLRVLMEEARCAWNPKDREAVLARAKEIRPVVEPHLGWFLTQGEPLLVREAMRFAVALRHLDSRPRIVAHMNHAAQRVLALQCADALTPFAPKELLKLLKDPDPDFACAAITIAGTRDPQPVAALLALLASPSASIRTAVLAALPKRLPESAREKLVALARRQDEGESIAGIRALALLPFDRDTELVLAEQLERPSLRVRCAALESLTAKRSPLDATVQSIVWQRVLHGVDDDRELVRTFLCLERTNSMPIDALRDRLTDLDGVGRYMAARCLVAADRAEGRAILIALHREAQPPELDGEPDDLGFAVRSLLARLTGLPASANTAAFEKKLQTTSVSARLPAPAFDLSLDEGLHSTELAAPSKD